MVGIGVVVATWVQTILMFNMRKMALLLGCEE
jgi:hypothetical protein